MLSPIQIRAQAELERRRRQQTAPPPDNWQAWLPAMFPAIFAVPFASHHTEFWQWVESITADSKPNPFIAVWARGGGKSSSVEAATVRLAAKGTRKFCLYIRSTQDKANESVTNIAAMLESRTIAQHYPLLSERKLSKYGFARGWRVDTLRCANGFSVIGLGLDAAVRGIKIEEQRPDIIFFDDLDDVSDAPRTVLRKIEVLTTSILPAGATNVAIGGVQNLIHEGGIFAQLVSGQADFLLNCQISGPHPAVVDLVYESLPEGGYRITGGTPTWEGQSLAICESQINEWGLASFLREAQHEIETTGGIWDDIAFRHIDQAAVPDIIRGAVWIDPAVTSTDESDCQAMQADGLGSDGKLYRFYSWEGVTSPEDIVTRAVLKCLELGFEAIGIETDQGGDTWQSVYAQVWQRINEAAHWWVKLSRGGDNEAEDWIASHTELAAVAPLANDIVTQRLRQPQFRSAKAGQGHGSKVARNQRMLVSYEQGKVIHVTGTHSVLERSLKRFPNKPLDLADAAYWTWWDLVDSKSHSGSVGRVSDRRAAAAQPAPPPYLALRYTGNKSFPLTIGRASYMISEGWQRSVDAVLARQVVNQFPDFFEVV
jgi:hypothetical protein